MADDYDEVNPVPGLKTDLELLLSHFTNSKSVRYTDFAKIWCQMGFPTIFCGWGKEESLREMVETALRHAVGFWHDIYTFQVRMGGLYLMYAFFFSQPLDPPQKVRLTQSQWAAGRKLLEIIKEQKHLDAEYIYHKLHYYRAFYYVMAPQPYLVAQTRRSKVDDGLRREIPAEQNEQPRSTPTNVHSVFPPALINNMESLHRDYREMKSALISAEGVQDTEGLQTLKEDFYDVLKNGLKHMDAWKPGSSSFDPDLVTMSTSTAVVPSSPGQQGVNRRRLKEHAFERSGVMGRHQRHLVMDSSQSDSEKTFASPNRRPAKKKKRKPEEETGVVSEDEIANSSMPLCLDDDSAEASSSVIPIGDVRGKRDNLKTNSTSSESEVDEMGDALLRAMNAQSATPSQPIKSSDELTGESAGAAVDLVDVKPSKKGKGRRKGSSPMKLPSSLME